MSESSLLIVQGLVKHFPLGGGLFSKPRAWVRAVDGVSFEVHKGESFGLVGESGCGKTTLGRLLLRLIDPSSGRILFDGQEVTLLNRTEMRSLRRRMQIIFQDPYSSLDPRMKVKSIVTEPLRAVRGVSRAKRRDRAVELLELVGLKVMDLEKYPHEFSGGQRQRIGIARAFCARPELIVADEPVSALDVSIQAQIINLMDDLKEKFNLSYIFISHDLSIVEHTCDRIAVMYLGAIVELAPREIFSTAPCHPYTRALLMSVPHPDPRNRSKPFSMDGDVPNPIDPPTGCTFHPRCHCVMEICSRVAPELKEISPGHQVACHLDQD